MSAMWVVLGIVCALTLLLCIPISADVRWENGAQVTVRWLFLRFAVYPFPPKKEKAKRKQKKEAEPAPQEEKPKKKMELSELAGIAVDIVESASPALSMIFHNLRIRKFVLDASIAGEDAADTAIRFGRMQAVLHGALGVLRSAVRFVNPELRVRPDFLGEETVFTLRFLAVLTPLVALAAAIRAACAFLRRTMRRGAQKTQANNDNTADAARPAKKRSVTANERG